jgi:hypothetical protein
LPSYFNRVLCSWLCCVNVRGCNKEHCTKIQNPKPPITLSDVLATSRWCHNMSDEGLFVVIWTLMFRLAAIVRLWSQLAAHLDRRDQEQQIVNHKEISAYKYIYIYICIYIIYNIYISLICSFMYNWK